MATTLAFSSTENACDFIQAKLREQGIETERVHTHHTRDGIHINLIEKNTNKTHHVKFSKEPFHAFGYFFKAWKGEKGDSLDDSVLETLQDTDVLYFAYPDKILKTEKERFVQPKLYRKNNKGILTCSFALSDMEVFA